MKLCVHCKETKERDCFYRNRSQPDGLESWCIVCRKKYRSDRPAAKPNDDPYLTPFNRLWYPGSVVIKAIHDRYPPHEVRWHLPKNGGSYRQYQKLTDGKGWIRLDAADELLVRLGILLSELPVEPTFAGHPNHLPKGDSVAA